MSEEKYIKGLRTFAPGKKAPDWVLANLVIFENERQMFIEWLQSRPPGDIKLDVLKGKDGTPYTKENTFKPKPRENAPSWNDLAQKPMEKHYDMPSQAPVKPDYGEIPFN